MADSERKRHLPNMLLRGRRAIVYLLLALILALGTTASSVIVNLSHNPAVLVAAESERHAEIERQLAEHGHSHEDGVGDESQPGHVHGHDPADHSHDTAGQAAPLAAIAPPAWRVSLVATGLVTPAGMNFHLERPPRQLRAA